LVVGQQQGSIPYYVSHAVISWALRVVRRQWTFLLWSKNMVQTPGSSPNQAASLLCLWTSLAVSIARVHHGGIHWGFPIHYFLCTKESPAKKTMLQLKTHWVTNFLKFYATIPHSPLRFLHTLKGSSISPLCANSPQNTAICYYGWLFWRNR
jgi:hypothetical protein